MEHTPELRELLMTDSNTLRKLPLLQCFYFPVAIKSFEKATMEIYLTNCKQNYYKIKFTTQWVYAWRMASLLVIKASLG